MLCSFQLIEKNNMHGLKRMSEENTVIDLDKIFPFLIIFIQESANKLYGEVRENRTRKNNPTNCLKDMLVHGRVSCIFS